MAPSQPSWPGLPMRPASDIPRTNAGSLEHSELVRMIAEANGAQVHELGVMWNDLGGEVSDFGASLQRTATSSESIWIGQAATAARMKLSELVTWCQDTGEKMQHMGTAVMRTQAEAAEIAQVSMPAPVPYDPAAYQNRINSTSNPIEWVQIQGDARVQAARHDAAHAEAIRVIETYSTSLLSTNGAMPAFTPPPEFGNRDAEPGPGVPAPGGSGGGAASGGAGGSPGSGSSPQIAPGSGGGGPGGSGPGGSGPGGGSPDPGGDSPDSGGRPPESGPPAPTPGQMTPHIPSIPGPSVPPGGGGGGPGLLPATAGIGGIGAAGRGSSVSGGRGGGAGREFGPRGSGASNALGRGGVGSTGAAESATGTGRGVAGMAGRGPGVGPGTGGSFPPMVGGGHGRGEKDTEHRRPSYLVETEDIWGDGRYVAPPVIGEDPPEYYR